MRLSQLRYFIEVCRSGNITRASEALYVSQPTVTTAIKDLEKDLGVSLFHRIKQRIYLTNEGKYFLGELEPILSQLTILSENMADLGSKKNHVKVGIPPMMGSFLFPTIFSGFQKAHPEIRLEILEHGALEVQKLVGDEILDLAVMIAEGLVSRDIEYSEIMRTNFRYFTHRRHPLAKRKSVDYSDLEGYPLVMFNEGFYVNRMVTDGFGKAGIEPNIVLLTGQINTIKRFVEENIASTFLIEDCVGVQDKMIKIPLKSPASITIVLGWKIGRHLYSDAIKFIKFVENLFQKV